MLRRRVKGDLAVVDQGDPNPLRLGLADLTNEVIVDEYAVLITSLPQEILTLALEAADHLDRAQTKPDQLQRDPSLQRLEMLGLVDHAIAALAD